MRYQSWSEVPKNGEPEDHRLAVEALLFWYMKYTGFIAHKDYLINFRKDFIKKHNLQYFFHKYDLVVTNIYGKIIIVVEVGQAVDDVVTLPDGRKLKISKSKHSKSKQIMNDQISEDYIKEYYPNAEYIKIDKSDCFNNKYLEKHLI